MSLEDAIQRNRARQAAKQASPAEILRPYSVQVLTNPPIFMIELGLAKVERKTITVYGTTRADAMRRAGD